MHLRGQAATEYLDEALALHCQRFERPLYGRVLTAFVRMGTRTTLPR